MQKNYNNIFSKEISEPVISSRTLLLRFFEIKNMSPDCRYSAFKDWESSARNHLAQKSSVIHLVR